RSKELAKGSAWCARLVSEGEKDGDVNQVLDKLLPAAVKGGAMTEERAEQIIRTAWTKVIPDAAPPVYRRGAVTIPPPLPPRAPLAGYSPATGGRGGPSPCCPDPPEGEGEAPGLCLRRRPRSDARRRFPEGGLSHPKEKAKGPRNGVEPCRPPHPKETARREE